MNRFLINLRTCFCVFLTLCGFVGSVQADDWEYWGGYEFNFKLTDKTIFQLMPKTQLREDLQDFYYWESIQGFKHKLHKNFDVGLYHLYADKKNTAGKWTDENRARVDIVWKRTIGELKLSDRNRYEYRVVGAKPKSRYRNEIKVAKEIDVLGRLLTAYISNEFFYDFRASEYNQNRGQIGVTKKFNEKVSSTVYYMKILEKNGSDWSGPNVFGTKLALNF